MKKLIQILIILFTFEQITFAGFFDILKSDPSILHTPQDKETDINPNAVIKLTYGEKINRSVLSSNNVILTKLSENKVNIKGTVTYIKSNKTISFTPINPLKSGWYEVVYKDILKVDSNFFFFSSWIKIETLKFTFEVLDKKMTNIQLSKSDIQLNIESNFTTINVTAVYDNNTTKDVTNNADWIVSDNSVVSINKNILTPIKIGNITIQAKYKNLITKKIAVNVYKKIDDFILPPEPDETLNNSTLLGIDSNDNGIRDDIERWILLDKEIYYANSKIERSIAFEKARAYQMTLADPTNKDDIVNQAMTDANDCRAYYVHVKNIDKKSYIGKENRNIKDRTFNTKERFKTYWHYDGTLGGRVFTSIPTRLLHTRCPQNIYDLMKGQ